MRKVTVHYHDSQGSFSESFVENERGSFKDNNTNLKQWVTDLFARFNSVEAQNYPDGLTVRHVDSIEIEDSNDIGASRREHDWHKTNAFTRTFVGGVNHGQTYDAMKCEVCGVEGKRYGVRGVKRDTKFRAKKYEICKGQPVTRAAE